MINRKIVFISLLAILIVVLTLIINNNKNEEISPIQKIINSYSEFSFEDIDYNNDFTSNIYQINYTYSKTNIKMLIDDQTLNISIVNGKIHLLYKGIDYIYENIKDVIKIMEYKSCNCDSKCLYLIALTDTGYVYYINIHDNINNLNDIILNKLEIEDIILDLGYIENLDKIDTCGVNGIGLKTKTSEMIIDNEFKNFNQDYYKTIKNIYVYNDGTIKTNNKLDLNQRIVLIFMNNNDYYFISKDGYLCKIDSEFNVKKLNDKKAIKIGTKKTNSKEEIIIVLEDGIAKKYEIKDNLIIR